MAWASFTVSSLGGALERGYRRPYAKLALRLKFAFYPLLAIAALAWLGWDWSQARNLAAAEDAIFETVIGLRPSEPLDRKSTRLNSHHSCAHRMPSYAWNNKNNYGR